MRETIVEVSGAGDSSVDADLIVAAGMLTSEVGLVAVPHAMAPAGLSELADAVAVRTIPEIGAWPIPFVPRIRTPVKAGPDGWMRADVMRGEKCETLRALSQLSRLGLHDADRQERAFVWPGSHTKLVEVDRLGRITRSQTSLAGEFLQAIARHTLIADSLPSRWPESLDLDAAEAGARAVNDQGLERAGFLVRIAAMEGAVDLDRRASFWVGAVVADDIRHLTRHPILAPSRPVWVGGREPLHQLYARWLGRSHRGPVNHWMTVWSMRHRPSAPWRLRPAGSNDQGFVVDKPSLKRLQDQTTCPMMHDELSSSISTGTRGNSRPWRLGRRIT